MKSTKLDSIKSNKLIDINEVDQKTTLLVFGFVRSSQKELNNLNRDIPELISYICVSYYWIFDYVAIPGNAIKSSDQFRPKTIVKESEGTASTCYGALRTNSPDSDIMLSYEWEIKLTRIHPEFTIGIASNTTDWDRDFTESNCPFYCIYGNGLKESHKTSGDYTSEFVDAQIIKMTFNASKRELSFCIDDANMGIAFSDIELEYENGTVLNYHLAI
eukprot:405337_1